MNRLEQDPLVSEAKPLAKLGQYKLLEKIAQGGMAQVFKAQTVDPSGIERLVVIKRILPHISSQPEYVEMLVDEAKIAVHFTHGNIAQVYDLGRVADDYFIVMEYVDGRTFSQINKMLIERHQKIPLDILLYCFIELCRGLSYIHRKTGPSGKPLGVVHRDISPQNMILSYAGNVKIIDFGVARADFIEAKTEHGVLKGKFAYMSPEQTKGDKIDHRSDIFSVGTLLWELATGERLFKRPTNQETIKAVQKAKFDLPSERRADIPKALDRIIRKALARNPRARYQDANDMAVDLEKLLFSINPEFRPITAAKFLYDLFGPEKDEASLPPPFFVKAEPVREEKAVSQVTGKSKMVRAKRDEEVPTIKENSPEDLTPVVKISRLRRFSNWNTLVGIVVVLIFLLGSFYAYRIHQLNKKAYLHFTGTDPSMHLFLNGKPRKWEDHELVVKSNKLYEIKISKTGYKDYLQQIQLNPREHAEVPVRMDLDIPPFGDLIVNTHPAGATVFIDGKQWPQKTPVTITNLITDQSYKIRVALDKYYDVTRDVKILGGKEINLDLPLSVNYAGLLVASTPSGADIYLNDVKIGKTPYRLDQLYPGEEHRVRLSYPGYLEESTSVELEPGELKLVDLYLQPLGPEPASQSTANQVKQP